MVPELTLNAHHEAAHAVIYEYFGISVKEVALYVCGSGYCQVSSDLLPTCGQLLAILAGAEADKVLLADDAQALNNRKAGWKTDIEQAKSVFLQLARRGSRQFYARDSGLTSASVSPCCPMKGHALCIGHPLLHCLSYPDHRSLRLGPRGCDPTSRRPLLLVPGRPLPAPADGARFAVCAIQASGPWSKHSGLSRSEPAGSYPESTPPAEQAPASPAVPRSSCALAPTNRV